MRAGLPLFLPMSVKPLRAGHMPTFPRLNPNEGIYPVKGYSSKMH